jgi:hypothetical protein
MNFIAIVGLVKTASDLIKNVRELIAIAQQDKALTDDEIAVLRKQLDAISGDSKPAHWRVEP